MFRRQVYRKVGEASSASNSPKISSKSAIDAGRDYFNSLIGLPFVQMTAEQVAHRCVLFDWFAGNEPFKNWNREDIQALQSILDSRDSKPIYDDRWRFGVL